MLPDYGALMMTKIFMVEEALLEHDIWGSDYLMWYDAGGAHVYGDQVSSESGPAATKLELLVQQPIYLNTFTATNIFTGFEDGTKPYFP